MNVFGYVERKEEKHRENYWDWNLSAWSLRAIVYGYLDMLNAKMMVIGSNNVCQWILREQDTCSNEHKVCPMPLLDKCHPRPTLLEI